VEPSLGLRRLREDYHEWIWHSITEVQPGVKILGSETTIRREVVALFYFE